MNIAKSTLQVFLGRLCKSLISFLAIIVFSRILGAAALGTYYPFLALLGILAIPADFGIRTAAVKRISEGTDPNKYLGTAVLLKLPLLFLISIFILLGSRFINQYLGADLAHLLVVTLIISQLADLSLGVLRAELRVGETAVLEVIRPLAWLVVGYILFIEGYGVTALVLGYLIGSFALAVAGWWKVSISIGRPRFHNIKSIYDYSRFSVISTLGSYIYNWMDVAILTLFVVQSDHVMRGDVGAYENAWRVSLFVMILSRSIATTIFPQLSKWDSDGARNKIENIIPKALLPSLLLVIPAFIGVLFISSDLLRMLFGEEFIVASIALIILSAEKIVQSIQVVIGQALQGVNRPDLAAYATIISILSNIVLNVILIPIFGITGAAIATMASATINTMCQYKFLSRFIKIRFPTRDLAWGGMASVMMGSYIFIVKSHIGIKTTQRTLLVILTSAIIYLLIILAYTPIRRKTRQILGPIFSDIVSNY